MAGCAMGTRVIACLCHVPGAWQGMQWLNPHTGVQAPLPMLGREAVILRAPERPAHRYGAPIRYSKGDNAVPSAC